MLCATVGKDHRRSRGRGMQALSGARLALLTVSLLLFLAPTRSLTDYILADLPPLIQDVSVGGHLTVQRSSGSFVEASPGIKHGELVSCIRLRVPSISRTRNLGKYANSFRIKVELLDQNIFHASQKLDVCLHGNESLGLGQCSRDSWQAFEKGSWNGLMSPFEAKYLDLRIRDSLTDIRVKVSVKEEFWPFRLVFLTCGLILLLVAPIVSSWVPFYYSSAMMLGVFLIVIVLLFQGMKLLPMGRKSSLYIIFYGSVVGIGTVIIHYFTGLVASISKELGISNEAYNPVGIFLALAIGLMGSWLGYWGVRKMVLSEDGTIDNGTAQFVKWAIRIVASVMILQSSHDPLFALSALLASLLFCWLSNKVHVQDVMDMWDLSWSFLQEQLFWKNSYIFKSKRTRADYQFPKTEFLQKDGTLFIRSQRGSLYQPSLLSSKSSQGSPLSSSNASSREEEYLSTFHKTPRRQGLSQREWTQVTKQHTTRALQELASSPKFVEWFAKNAERVMITPNEHRDDRSLEEVQTTAYMAEADEGVANIKPRCWGFL